MKFSITALAVVLGTAAAFAPTRPYQDSAVTHTAIDTTLNSWLSDTAAEVKKKVGEFVEHADVYEGVLKDELDWKKRVMHPMLPGTKLRDVPMKGSPLSKSEGIVRGSVDEVWKKFRHFGSPDITDWWKIYKGDSVTLNGPDEVGVERSFTVGPRETKEILADRDDKKHRLVYKLSYTKGYPTGYEGTTTEVKMQDAGKDEQGNPLTKVIWQSWSDIHPLLVDAVQSGQEHAYSTAIQALDRYFHPSIGSIDIKLESGSGFAGADRPYVVLSMDGTTEETGSKKGSHPTWNEAVKFDLTAKDSKVMIAVMDAQEGKDSVVGTTILDVASLQEGNNELTLDLDGSQEKAKIEVMVDLSFDPKSLKQVNAPPPAFDIATIQAVGGDIINKAFDAIIVQNMGEQKTLEYGRYDRSPQIPDVPLENLPRQSVGLPYGAQLSPHKLSRIVQRLTEYVYSQADWPIKWKLNLDKWTSFYGQYLQPNTNTRNTVKHHSDDREQARQYLAGMSPLTMKMVMSLDELPSTLLQGVDKLGGESLQSLVDRKALFFCDYELLDGLELYEDMVFYAPLALIYQPKGSDELHMGAIQLERNAVADVYTNDPKDTAKSRWQYARLQLACADNQYHQFIYHLGYAHLAMEPFIVSTHNSFPKDHILHQLLTPHFKDTVGINFLARQTLVSEVKPITDRTFSPGTAQAMQLFLKAWERYDFFENNFENDLKNRGFFEDQSDGVKDYYYREDGFRVWNAIGNYVTKVVDHEYATDADVEKDRHIQKWAAETSDADKAAIPGFPTRIASKELLVKCLQTIIWNVSAAHSAVNFSQYDYLSYVPNRPNALFRKMPKGDKRDEIPKYETDFLDAALPQANIGHFEILFSWLLTTPPEITLNMVDSMKDVVPDAHVSFQQELAQIHDDIASRNDALAKAGKPNYPFLDPHNIEASIAI